MAKATIYLEQDGEVLFTHQATGDKDDKRMANFALNVFALTGMTGYTMGKSLTARVEWEEVDDAEQ